MEKLTLLMYLCYKIEILLLGGGGRRGVSVCGERRLVTCITKAVVPAV